MNTSELIKAGQKIAPVVNAILEQDSKVIKAAKELSEKYRKESRRNHNPSQREREEAAEMYARAEKSDPFARARIRTHMNNGVCGFTQQGGDAFYSAEEHMEDRMLDNGTKYQAPVYRNRVRP